MSRARALLVGLALAAGASCYPSGGYRAASITSTSNAIAPPNAIQTSGGTPQPSPPSQGTPEQPTDRPPTPHIAIPR